ncbi:MAG TPA: EAL domain-containing protein, partial [Alphaproteobacteria bacterium]|nr:EAL domain-containing protein [Alphaproteobacteria bacterium]
MRRRRLSAPLGHALAAAGYTALATATAIAVPPLGLAAGPLEPLLAGGLVFLAGGLLHEVALRRALEARLAGEAARLSGALDAAAVQIAALHRELAAARGEAAAPAARYEALASEMRMLHDIVERMLPGAIAPQAAGLAAAPAAAAGAPRDEAQILALLRAALQDDRLDVLLQPIVSLPQRKVRHYELFSRIRGPDNAYVMPEQYIPIAERSGLVAAIDNLLLFRSVQLIREMEKRHLDFGFHLNVSGHSLRDGPFMQQFLGYMGDGPHLPLHLVFEFAAADFAAADGPALKVLDRLVQLGFHLSLDHVPSLALDLPALAGRGVRT